MSARLAFYTWVRWHVGVLEVQTGWSYNARQKLFHMSALIVHEHALIHGLSENQVLHAWKNAISVARRGCESGEVDFVAIGFDQRGRLIEMVGRKKSFGVLIFHANTPPTARAFRELGLNGGSHGRGH